MDKQYKVHRLKTQGSSNGKVGPSRTAALPNTQGSTGEVTKPGNRTVTGDLCHQHHTMGKPLHWGTALRTHPRHSVQQLVPKGGKKTPQKFALRSPTGHRSTYKHQNGNRSTTGLNVQERNCVWFRKRNFIKIRKCA